MQEPLVSVIIPTYNRESLIVRAVQSVLKQTYQRIELIVVDDGSTDNTKENLAKIKDPRLKVMETDGRKGANFARNLGVKNAKGHLIAFQDSDDVWQVDKLEVQIRCLLYKKSDAVFSSFVRVTATGARILPFEHLRRNMVNNAGVVKVEDCLRENVISTQVLLLQKSVFNELGGFDDTLNRLQDWDLAIRLINEYKVHFMDIPLATVYEQTDSISVKPELALESRKVFLEKFYGIYKRYPKIYKRVLYDYYKLLYKNRLSKLSFFLRFK